MKNHKVWIVVVKYNPDQELESASIRAQSKYLDESEASIAAMSVLNFINDREPEVGYAGFTEDYEVLDVGISSV